MNQNPDQIKLQDDMMHERKPNRMKGYDYSLDNLYFVTSCVHDRVCCLGTVRDGEMILNEYGKIAEQQWYWLADQYPYVVLHPFVVMPNHIHGIIEIDRGRVVGTGRPVGTGRDLSLQGAQSPTKIKSLSQLMGAYKTTGSKQIHLLGFPDFKWQRSFHDHIIRDGQSYDRISNYILNNPKNWDNDKFYNNF
jgi:putative transposase